jgi:hypothetical protein
MGAQPPPPPPGVCRAFVILAKKTLQMPHYEVQMMQQNPHPWGLTLTQMPHPWGTKYTFSEDF